MKLVGIDLGGTEIKGGIFDWEGNLLEKKKCATPVAAGKDGVIEAIINLIQELQGSVQHLPGTVQGVGVGVPGPCDANGLVYTATNLFWTDVPLGELLENALGIPVFVENDATVAGVAEANLGALKGCKNGVLITLGTGVGGGLILNGAPFSGSHGLGSELGHMIVGENTFNCNCGSNGCLETFASASALIRYVKEKLQGHKESVLWHRCQGDLGNLTGEMIFTAAKEGDPVANQGVDHITKYLAIGIGNLITLLDPEGIALGGGLSHAGTFFLDKVKAQVQQYTFFKQRPLKTKISLATLGNDGGIAGAALLAKGRLQGIER